MNFSSEEIDEIKEIQPLLDEIKTLGEMIEYLEEQILFALGSESLQIAQRRLREIRKKYSKNI